MAGGSQACVSFVVLAVRCAGGCGRGRRPRRSGSGPASGSRPRCLRLCVLTSGSGRPDLLVRARKRSSSSLRVPALPAALSSSALLRTWRLWRPLALGHRGADGALVEELAERGLVDHVRELVRREHVAEVHQRARHRGHRDPVTARDVARVEAAVRVRVHAARCPPSAWHEHVNARHSAAPELQMNCGIEGGEVGAEAARQGRGHPLALLGEPRLPDRVHARILAVQPPLRRTLGDPRVREPGLHELGGRDHAVLPGRDRRDQRVRGGGWPEKLSSWERFSSHPPSLTVQTPPLTTCLCLFSARTRATARPCLTSHVSHPHSPHPAQLTFAGRAAPSHG